MTRLGNARTRALNITKNSSNWNKMKKNKKKMYGWKKKHTVIKFYKSFTHTTSGMLLLLFKEMHLYHVLIAEKNVW